MVVFFAIKTQRLKVSSSPRHSLVCQGLSPVNYRDYRNLPPHNAEEGD
jgi:hypothetical protein